MNLFDGLRDTMVDIVNDTMGYDATWQPKAGGPPQTAKVLFKDATQKLDYLAESSFEVYDYTMEYRKPYLNGLKDSTDNGEVELVHITVQGVTTAYWVQRVKALFDGNTLCAYLQKKKVNA